MKRSLTGVDSGGAADRWVLVGGSGFLGTAVARRLVAGGLHVTVVDRHRPRRAVRDDVDWIQIDLLEEEPVLPPGRVVVLTGSSDVPPVWQWTSALDNAVTMARLAPALVGRDVVLCSSVEVYGSAAGPLTERSAPTTAALDATSLRVVTVPTTLAQAPVEIDGTIELSGGQGHAWNVNESGRIPSVPGPGGFPGGLGNAGLLGASNFPGGGPGGGAPGSGGSFAGSNRPILLFKRNGTR